MIGAFNIIRNLENSYSYKGVYHIEQKNVCLLLLENMVKLILMISFIILKIYSMILYNITGNPQRIRKN